jgi:hypothetical protein
MVEVDGQPAQLAEVAARIKGAAKNVDFLNVFSNISFSLIGWLLGEASPGG